MYERIQDFWNKYSKKADEDIDNINILMMMDSIENFFECKTYKKYELVLKFCKENNIHRIYDIGCAFGFQSEIFLNSSITYIGIDEGTQKFWNNNKFQYIIGHYPFKIKAQKNDLAVSSLCLTWNCYLHEKEKTLREQCKALERDFAHCLLYITKDKIDFVNKYFKENKVLSKDRFGTGFVYFSNKN